jgi:hypothetical protein
MINFFRKIRKQLTDDNKPIKYLRYAIGEIVLVVIGILIALSINNWNTNRVNKQQEITVLKNIKQDINFDTLDIGFNLSYHKKFLKAEQDLLNFLMSKETSTKQVDAINHSDALGTLLFTALHQSTFANLQNNDMGLLRNNKLRKEISRFYDYFQQAVIIMSNSLESFDLYKRKLPYFKQYFRVTNELSILLDIQAIEDFFEHDLSKNDIQLWNIKGAKADEAFKITLNESLFFRKALIAFHETILEEIRRLNKSIDDEIARLNNS